MSAPADPLSAIADGLFRSMGVDGVYARTALYTHLVERLEGYITRQRDPKAEIMRFPPVMSRKQLEKSGYLKSFPNLLGCVCALHGSEASIRSAVDRYDEGGDWTTSVTSSDLVLSPAACYPVYPIVATRGALPAGGLQFDIEADVFRHEPSRSLDRLQSFRMREFVRIGSPQEILEFRESWMARAPGLAADLGLPFTIDVANDPFFGRVGQVMAVSQRQQALKFELLIPYYPGASPTACMSFNYHREHFGQVWGIHDD
ncbi:MAG: amino acid--[acyl-carrier-protein] ligase, partial [Steroidobacteraceae bacterium]